MKHRFLDFEAAQSWPEQAVAELGSQRVFVSRDWGARSLSSYSTPWNESRSLSLHESFGLTPRRLAISSQQMALEDASARSCSGRGEAFSLCDAVPYLAVSAKLRQRVMELLALQPDWDGEKANAPKPEVLAGIVSLVCHLKSSLPGFREPFLAPTISGHAQIEWHDERRSLEMELEMDKWLVVGSEKKVAGRSAYHEADVTRNDFEKLKACYRWFQGAELIWPIM